MEHLDKDMQWVMKYFEEKFTQRDKNLDQQAKEYERRLSDLNHENARILEAQEKSISVEKFDGVVGQIYQKQENTILELRRDINDLKEFKQKQEGKKQGGREIMALIAFFILVLGFLIGHFVIKK